MSLRDMGTPSGGYDPEFFRQRRAQLGAMRGGEAPEAPMGAVEKAKLGDGTQSPYAKLPIPQGQTGAGSPAAMGPVDQPQAAPKTYGAYSGAVGSKLNDLSYHTPKYDMIRAISDIGLPSFADGSGQAQLQKSLAANPFFKDARVDGDEIHYTGQRGQPVTIDFLKGYDAGHPELQYLTSDHGGAPAPNANEVMLGGMQGDATLPGTGPMPMPVGDTGQSDLIRRLMEELKGGKDDGMLTTHLPNGSVAY